MKKIKKYLVLSVFLIWSFSITVSAKQENLDIAEYKEMLNYINQEYNTELIFIDVDTEKVSLKQFETYMREVAEDERMILNYLQTIEILAEEGEVKTLYGIESRTTSTKSKDVGFNCGITCRYSFSGDKVTYIDSSLKMYSDAIKNGGALFNVVKHSNGYLNNQTIISIRYSASVILNNISYGNKTFYAEFKK